MTPKFICHPSNGRLNLENQEAFKRYVQTLPENKHEIIIRKFKKTRSNQENKYYWGVVLNILSDELGYLPEEIHQLMKERFLFEKEIEVAGRKSIVTKRTSKLTTVEFEQYLGEIKRFAASELSVFIPDPNQVSY